MNYIQAGAYENQKRALDVLEKELQLLVSYLIGSGNSTWVLHMNSKHSYARSHVSSPQSLQFSVMTKSQMLLRMFPYIKMKGDIKFQSEMRENSTVLFCF